MLLELADLIAQFNLRIKGIIHVGAHECEELIVYNAVGVPSAKILWIEANKTLFESLQKSGRNIGTIYNAIISDTDDNKVSFIVTNNGQSSSILELAKHKEYYPSITEVSRVEGKTKTLNTLFKENKVDVSHFNFVNMDIQGAELLALKGATDILPHIDYLYLEVNEQELYKGCGLISDIDKFVATFGFKRVVTKMTENHWGDALYIKDAKDSKHLKDSVPIAYPLSTDLKTELQFDNCNPDTNGEMWLWSLIKKTGFAGEHQRCCKIIIDVGLQTKLTYPDEGKIVQHCFEPNVKFYNQVKNSASQHVIINNVGLGSKKGSVTYYQHSESINKRDHYKCTENCSCKINVNIITLDEYIAEKKLDHIDFIKIDTEGYELEVLLGAKNTLPKVDMIQFEYGGTYPDNNIKLADVYKYLYDNNFKFIYLIQPTCLRLFEKPLENYKYSNYLATKVPVHLML